MIGRTGALILALSVLSSLLIGCAVTDQISSAGCRASSEEQINWDQKPKLENGYLRMSGTTKGGTRLHDPIAARTGTNWPAFGLNDLDETSETMRLKAVGNIYPREMRNRLASLNRDGKPRLLAETYDVTATSFDVRVALPDSLLDYNLVVSVWGENPGSDRRAIGAECVDN